MRQHGCDDVGVVNLPASYRNFTAQRDQRFGYHRTILEYLEAAKQSVHVIDEATRVKPEAWHALRSTLTATQGPVRIIGNVSGRRNWAYQLARRAEAGEPDMTTPRSPLTMQSKQAS